MAATDSSLLRARSITLRNTGHNTPSDSSGNRFIIHRQLSNQAPPDGSLCGLEVGGGAFGGKHLHS